MRQPGWQFLLTNDENQKITKKKAQESCFFGVGG